MNKPRIITILRILTGAVLLVSGIGKLFDNTDALHFLAYILTALNVALPVAPDSAMVALSVVEIMLGCFLVWGKFLRTTALVASVLMLGFTGVLLSVVGNVDVPVCGCSGALDFGLPVEMAVARNLVVVCLLAWMLYKIPEPPTSFIQ